MVSIAQTSRKYRGRKAKTYDAIREKQERWRVENEVVERWLRELRPIDSVLDCPVGTGRFVGFYRTYGVRLVTGIDTSEEMLALARKKTRRSDHNIDLVQGDAMATGLSDRGYDVAVCVRFLDLIDEDAMRAVVKELCRVARRAVILTIRFSAGAYRPKVNTAEHDRRKFNALVTRLKWRVSESVPFRDAGWEIVRLERRE